MRQFHPKRMRGLVAGAGVLGLALAGPVAAQQGGQPTGETVTLQVQDTDLGQVLEMLALQFQKNIITSKSVSATINANLFDVTLDQALDAILSVNGYTWVAEGSFIYIYTLSEFEEMEARKRKTESRIFELDYLAAADAAEMIQPLLSDDGKAVARGDVAGGFAPSATDAGGETYAFSARIVVNDYPENLELVAQLIDEIDMPPQQVLVEATIVQSTVNEANGWGVDFSAISSIDFTDLSNPLSVVTNLLQGNDQGADEKATSSTGFVPGDNKAAGLQSTVGNTSGPGGLKLGIVRDSAAAFIRVLDEVTDNTVLSRPKIMCLNRQRAEILIGTKVGYLSTSITETSATQTVEFLDTGIQLTFRPFISKNGMIRMELRPRVSEAFLRTATTGTGGVTTIPDESTNELTTNVRVKDGQTLVLGGLFREKNESTRAQVPLLGDVPVVGAAFKGHDDIVDRDEIIFLITPSIIKDELLWAVGESALDYSDRLMMGSRKGLLPFSRERQTSGYNSRAFDAFERGDLDKAVYDLDNSLRLNPRQPEMIKFRERILGVKETSYERSMMERIFTEKSAVDGPQSNANTRFAPVASTIGGNGGNGGFGGNGATPTVNAQRNAQRAAFADRFFLEHLAADGQAFWAQSTPESPIFGTEPTAVAGAAEETDPSDE